MTAHHLTEHPAPLLRAEAWTALAAEVLRLPEPELRQRAAAMSFVALGGTSLRAVELAALAERRLALVPEVGALLGPLPLAEVLATAAPVAAPVADAAVTPPGPADGRTATGGPRAASAGEHSMLLSDQVHPSTVHHLLFSAQVRGPLDERRLTAAIAALTARHEALRTVFAEQDGAMTARVLPRWTSTLIRQELRPPAGTDPVAAVHAVVAPAGRGLLRPLDRPAVAFVLTGIGPGHSVLSLLVHHALVDGWSIGVLWRDLVAAYRGDLATDPAPSPLTAFRTEDTEAARSALAVRLPELSGAPTTIELRSDLVRPRVADRRGARLGFALGPAAMAGCESLGRTTGLTRNTLLLAAWSFVLGRRAGASDLLIGMASASRTGATHDVVGLLTKIQPVRCLPDPASTVREFLGQVGADIRRALDTGPLPSERIVSALGAGGDLQRNPLTQFAFAAHDELVPDALAAGEVAFELHEGHCGGTLFDAVLYVQQWSADRSALALEYATSVLGFAEATALAAELDAVLVEFAIDPDAPLATAGDPSTAARTARERLATGPAVGAGTGLWQLFERTSREHPDAVAVFDPAVRRELTYRQLRRAAEQQSAVLRAAGVGEGDHVVLAHRRSAREIVSVLAVLRLGAAYVGLDEGAPDAVARRILTTVRPKALLGDGERLTALGLDSAGVVDPWDPGEADVGPAAAADPDRIAYIAFTSGSTGVPKGVRVPHRGVVRLVRGPGVLEPGSAERFLRFAPLAFDASTLEIFAPLTAGGSVEIHASPHLVPSAFRDFVRTRRITGLWLTAGLFRLVADHEPAAFRGVRQVLTGGDVVPPLQVRQVLEATPGLVVTNGYGPTENTTFTTVYHVRDAAGVEDPLPIGRPVPGTSVAVLDEHGHPLPPGAAGELHTAGDGLATDYLGDAGATALAFVTGPDGRRHYRTGDLVRWDGAGRLRYLGRRDNQLKIRGFRVEPDGIAHVLRDHPDVRDAVVVPTTGTGERLLVAAVVADDSPRLLPALAAHAERLLPGHALPTLWTVVDRLPLTGNGKVDAAVLTATAAPLVAATGTDPTGADRGAGTADSREGVVPPVGAKAPGPEESDDAVLGPDEIADAVADVWAEILDTDDFGYHERFFDVGGDSLQLAKVRNGLLRALPWCDVTVLDLLTHTTVDALAAFLANRHGK
ncbi:amino acid adenylation domain-containing protein [Kitasatospora purpeofusca]|uniref:amino acid adenylation domain-containing protein n=1 Tax=Kitasatospora purpeofusca TaxID=67352 RepID=UPI0035DC316C